MSHTLMLFAAIAQTTMAGAAAPETVVDAFTHLEGDWQGQLEYRDYQSDKLQAIPMRVEFDSIEDDTTFLQRSTFTDPGFPVFITTLINVDGTTVNVASSRAGRPFESYDQIARLTAGASANSWTMTTTRVGKDGDRLAVIREVMTRDGDDLTITKEIDYLDDDSSEWMFRNRVTLSAK